MNGPKWRPRLAAMAIALGLPLLAAGQGQAHGLRGTTDSHETVCANAAFDDGEPMGYGLVEVSAPDSRLPFQSGRTDKNGFFCFRPDHPGKWQVTISDETGHRIRMQTTVSPELALLRDRDGQTYNAPPLGRTQGLITGMALIFGLGGSLAWWRGRKRETAQSTP